MNGTKICRIWSCLLFAVSVAGLGTAATLAQTVADARHLSVGLPAPAISAQARNGDAVNLAAFRGKPIVLVFWGST